MPITYTDTTTRVQTAVKYENRVLKIREFRETRNMSDTLDYSDYQEVNCKQALVYVGRRLPRDHWKGDVEFCRGELIDVLVSDRFQWVDVSNHFAWRNGKFAEAIVDPNAMMDPNLVEDYVAWTEYHEAAAKCAEDRRIAYEAAQQKARAEEEKNKVVVGKKMIVAKGRKAPVGFVGVVAYVNFMKGSVLLKKENEWQDRKADGVWTYVQNLRAV